MSECTQGKPGCECIEDPTTGIQECYCGVDYIPREGNCYGRGCYDKLTDTFCGGYPNIQCNEVTRECDCKSAGLETVNGRCVSNACLTNEMDSSEKIECWNRGYCSLIYGSGECVCFDAYINRLPCLACDPTKAIERQTESSFPECIPKICLDPVTNDVNAVCNGYGTCTPFIQRDMTMTYFCRCNQFATHISNMCYPNECIGLDAFVANEYTVCHKRGVCNVTKKLCTCDSSYRGLLCNNCADGFSRVLTLSTNAINFTCISTTCLDPMTNTFCGGRGNCINDRTTGRFSCKCNSGSILFSSTLCLPVIYRSQRIGQQLSLSLIVLVFLIGLSVLALFIDVMYRILQTKRVEREHVRYVRQRKIEIARSLHNEAQLKKDISTSSSVLSTMDYITMQRRYM